MSSKQWTTTQLLRSLGRHEGRPLATPPLIVRRLTEAGALDQATSSEAAGGAERVGMGSGEAAYTRGSPIMGYRFTPGRR